MDFGAAQMLPSIIDLYSAMSSIERHLHQFEISNSWIAISRAVGYHRLLWWSHMLAMRWHLAYDCKDNINIHSLGRSCVDGSQRIHAPSSKRSLSSPVHNAPSFHPFFQHQAICLTSMLISNAVSQIYHPPTRPRLLTTNNHWMPKSSLSFKIESTSPGCQQCYSWVAWWLLFGDGTRAISSEPQRSQWRGQCPG